jgi:hypothetical protein
MTLVAFVRVLVAIIFPAAQRPPPIGVPQQQQADVGLLAGGVPQHVIAFTAPLTTVAEVPEVIGIVFH